jgi:hypothetical protein
MCWWAARSDAKKERFWHFIVPSLIFSAGFTLTVRFLAVGLSSRNGRQHRGVFIDGSSLLHVAGLISRRRSVCRRNGPMQRSGQYRRVFRALDPRLRQTEIGRLPSVVCMRVSRADRSHAGNLLAVH